MVFVLAMIVIGLLMPEEAYAWAPATHLFYAKEVLHFSHLLPHAVSSIITHYSTDFLYGCMAADITLGKKFVEYIYNCHNFDVGLGLLDHARNPAEKAFVYGYIAHLATDTVSHNFFVPYQNIEHFESRRFRHAYWEVRLDQFYGDRVWHDVQLIIKNPRNHTHDQLLDTALEDTLFSFKTNKVLFSSMLAVQRLRKWQLFVKSVNRLSAMQLNPHHISEYNKLAVSAIIRLLSEGKDSCVYRVDPTGCKTLEEVADIRHMLHKLRKKGELTREMHQEECQKFRHHVRTHFFEHFPVDAKDFHPSIHMKV